MASLGVAQATAPAPPRAIPRLKRRAEFLRVAGAGRKFVAPGLILQVLRRAPAADRPSGGALRQLGAPVEPPVESAGVESAGVESAGVESAGVEAGGDAPRIGYTASRH